MTCGQSEGGEPHNVDFVWMRQSPSPEALLKVIDGLFNTRSNIKLTINIKDANGK
jgi:hypothetical protein